MSDQPNIAAIVLAAGRSTRMGDVNKLLADFNGEPMVARTLAQVELAGIEHIYVVTGHEAEKVEGVLSKFQVRFVHNERFGEGLSTSVIAGISALCNDIDGALIILGDMPLVRSKDIAALVAAFKDHCDICVPVCKGRRGNPVLWGRDYYSELQNLQGDQGARQLLELYCDFVVEVEIADDGVLRDFDTITELEKS